MECLWGERIEKLVVFRKWRKGGVGVGKEVTNEHFLYRENSTTIGGKKNQRLKLSMDAAVETLFVWPVRGG